MNQQLLLQNVAALPPVAQQEAFDFIDFLKLRYTQHNENVECSTADTQQILEMLKNIKPVKCKYSSEQIIQSLREEKPLS